MMQADRPDTKAIRSDKRAPRLIIGCNTAHFGSILGNIPGRKMSGYPMHYVDRVPL